MTEEDRDKRSQYDSSGQYQRPGRQDMSEYVQQGKGQQTAGGLASGYAALKSLGQTGGVVRAMNASFYNAPTLMLSKANPGAVAAQAKHDAALVRSGRQLDRPEGMINLGKTSEDNMVTYKDGVAAVALVKMSEALTAMSLGEIELPQATRSKVSSPLQSGVRSQVKIAAPLGEDVDNLIRAMGMDPSMEGRSFNINPGDESKGFALPLNKGPSYDPRPFRETAEEYGERVFNQLAPDEIARQAIADELPGANPSRLADLGEDVGDNIFRRTTDKSQKTPAFKKFLGRAEGKAKKGIQALLKSKFGKGLMGGAGLAAVGTGVVGANKAIDRLAENKRFNKMMDAVDSPQDTDAVSLHEDIKDLFETQGRETAERRLRAGFSLINEHAPSVAKNPQLALEFTRRIVQNQGRGAMNPKDYLQMMNNLYQLEGQIRKNRPAFTAPPSSMMPRG